MKFRARIHDPYLFSRLVCVLERNYKDVVIQISQDMLYFIARPPEGADAVQVWSGIRTDALLSGILLQSLNNNEITLRVSVDHLARALKSGATSESTTIKLTKQDNCPFLNISVVSLGTPSSGVQAGGRKS